jgi:hypothetical protein
MLKNDIGFYTVGDKKFSNKLDAVLSAQLTNSKVEWNFFDDVFSRVDWLTEPDISLDEFYKIRAEQIRNAYDYVIVFCSGGADSTNVIRSFIKNNIKVDEVIGIAPMSGLKNWEYNSRNVSDLNTISETKFALLPLLDELSTKHNIKVTLYDFFEDMVNYQDEEWAATACGNIATALTPHFTNVSAIPHIDKIIQSGKRVALVYGTDKPIMTVDSVTRSINFILADGGVNYLNMPDSRAKTNVDRVLFYWTPELPAMLVKQAHVVAKALQTPELEHILKNPVVLTKTGQWDYSYQDVINHREKNNIAVATKEDILKKYLAEKKHQQVVTDITQHRTIYQRAITPFIYPSTFTSNLWQSQKIDIAEGFFTRDQDWLHLLHPNSRMSDIVLAGTKTLYNSIKPAYLNPKGTGFRSILKYYKVGQIPAEKIGLHGRI